MSKTVLITGASSGIGAAFARRLAADGYDLILTGRRKENLDSVAAEIRTRHQRKVDVLVGDLTDPKHLVTLEELIRSTPVEFLVNNAGYGMKKHFVEEDIQQPDRMVSVHITAPLHLIRAAIPGMMERKSGTIINLSSIAGFAPTATDPTYGASKIFLTQFTESLYLVLHQHGIRLQALCPGFTWTNFHEKLGIPVSEQTPRGILRWMTAERVVNASMRALERNIVVCIPGFLNHLTIWVARLLPRKIYYLIMTGKTLKRR
jgi:short-subunit dehydrogenase